MSSQALASVLAGNTAGVSTIAGRKMDRVFTQSMGAQTVPPRYMRNGRSGARNGGGGGGGNVLDYMMEQSGAAQAGGQMYSTMPATHYRTISGSGGVDEYDYVPAQVSYRYDNRQPIRRRTRGQPMRSYGMPRNERRYVSRVAADVRGQLYEDAIPMRNRFRRDSRRTSYRISERYADEPNLAAQRKPRRPRRGPRSRANTEQQQQAAGQPQEAQQPSQEASNDEARRAAQRPPRRRRRRTTSTAAATNGSQNKAETPAAIRTRRFACNFCRQVFRTDNLRIRHIRTVHTRRRDFVCKECRAVFPTARSITTHLSKPHQEERQPAAEQRRRPPLGVPIRYLPDGMTIFSCPYCPFGFLNARDAESHQSRCRASQRLSIAIDVEYPGNDQYTMYCFCCPELLSLRQGLKEHFSCLHSYVDLTISYHCALCAKKFASEEEAADHLKNDHTAEELATLQKNRQDSFIEESIASYQSARPVSMVRIKAEVRQVLGRLLRQVSAKVRSS